MTAGLGVAGLALLGAAPALAADVDPSIRGSITVHKFEMPESPTGLPNNGTEVDTTGLEPLEGVTFQARKVNEVDLSTNVGWTAANELVAGLVATSNEAAAASITAQSATLGAPVSGVTNGDGEYTFDDLGIGLYLVTETAAPAGTTPVKPFLVTVPLTDPGSRTGWLYDVHVYPKNSVAGATKTVDDSTIAKPGDKTAWTITADIPNDAVISAFKIVDPLDPRLTLDAASVAATLSNGTSLEAGTDYTVASPTKQTTRAASAAEIAEGYVYEAGEDYTELTVELTAAGLAKLAANNSASVVVTFSTTVKQGAVVNGPIPNQATIYPNQDAYVYAPGNPGEPPTPPEGTEVPPPAETNVPVGKWGNITFHKVDTSDANLPGAEFTVEFRVLGAGGVPGAWTPFTLGDGTSTWTSDATGLLTVPQLRYSGWADGAAVASGAEGYVEYRLIEVKAPAGFELLPDPIPFTIDDATSTLDPDGAYQVDMTVENVPSNAGFTLPLTGGAGSMVIYAAGVFVLAGAVLLLVRTRRKAEATES